MKTKIIGILVCMLLIATALQGTGESNIFIQEPKGDIWKEIDETKDKFLVVDKMIGDKHVKYWEHIINNFTVKGDYILLHLDKKNSEILYYERSWTDVDLILSDSLDKTFKTNDYFWNKLVVFPDESDCTYFYTFHDTVEYPLACWEVRYTDGKTIMYDLDGYSIGKGVPAPSKGLSLSGDCNSPPSPPDCWEEWRLNADYWFKKWVTSTKSLSIPAPSTISSYVSNLNYNFFFEIAHGGEYYFKVRCTGVDVDDYYCSDERYGPSYYNVKEDMNSRLPMWFAFIASCEGMNQTDIGTFSYEFRKSQMIDTVTVGYDNMSGSPGWSVSLEWQGYMFKKMDEGCTIKVAFDLASAYYPLIAECVKFVGDEELTVFKPSIPDQPSGPILGYEGILYDYSTVTNDPNGDDVYYKFDWGDGNYSGWMGPYLSGDTCIGSNFWTEQGLYELKVKAKDVFNDESDWSPPLYVMINWPPEAPSITGETNGNAGTEYEYTFNAVDPDGDDVEYFIDWGDGDTEWTGFSASGTPVIVSHTWAEKDTYTIAAKAQDEYGLEGDWATLEVEMPVNQQVINPLLQMILERFPILEQILLRLGLQ